jgi:dienelactone hydrolase
MTNKVLYPLIIVVLLGFAGCKVAGTITDGASALHGIPVILAGEQSLSTTTDIEGAYTFKYLKPGTYTVSPSLAGYTFDPPSYTVTLKTGEIAGLKGLDFTVVSAVEPPETSPEEMGPYHVGYYKTSYTIEPYGTYQAVIRYPALSDGLRTQKDARGAPYPGIAVCNGLLGQESQITWIPEHLTSHGYVTICFTPPDPALFDITQWATGFSAGISRIKNETQMSNSPVSGLLDTERFGSIGLSMGGGGSIEAAGSEGSEIDAAVGLAPAGFSSEGDTDTMAAARNIRIPTQIQVGTNDGLVPPADARPFYDAVIPDETIKEYVEINGGNHIGFLDETYAGIATILKIDNPIGIAFAEQRRLSGKYFTAWFQFYLKGLPGYYTYLFGPEAQDDHDSGKLSEWLFNVP